MWAIVVAAGVALSPSIRSTDPVIGEALADTIQQSDVVRKLVDVIEGSNLIVYLARGDCPKPAIACLMMAGGSPDVRYVRINFRLPEGLGQASGWHRSELSISIAHELQHAAEIAQWPEVVDPASLQAAYARRGLACGGQHLDTDAAIRAGKARRAELGRKRRW
jgi:hypothetical protein